jgi:hypothetical protein
LNITEIVSHLKAERTRIDDAISALEGFPSDGTAKRVRTRRSGGQQKARRLSAAGRKRISDMMKKRWAERRKKAAAKGK